jgi:hypothetical protein
VVLQFLVPEVSWPSLKRLTLSSYQPRVFGPRAAAPQCLTPHQPNSQAEGYSISDRTCPSPSSALSAFGASFDTEQTFYNSVTERSMTLAEEAKRVAAEFDYSDEDVNKAVKEFIRQMGASFSASLWYSCLLDI